MRPSKHSGATASAVAVLALTAGGALGSLAVTGADGGDPVAAKSAKPKRITLACALKSDGTLRFVSRARACRTRVGTLMRLDPGPAEVCIRTRGTRSGRLKAAAAPRVRGQLAVCGPAGSPNGSKLQLPAASKVFLCVEKRSKVMRRSTRRGRCRARGRFAEFRGFVAKRTGTPFGPANGAPVAEADRAATDEQSPIEMAVVANDRDPDGDPLVVATVDPAGTAGTVTAGPGGSVGYVPGASFDGLKPGESATDSFTYTARDPAGATSAPARVEVTVAGVNDAPGIAAGPGPASTFTEDQAGSVVVDDGIGVADADSGELTRATVAITGGRQGGDTLGFPDTARITGTYDSGTGVLTLTGTDSVAGYQDALRTVTFSTTSQDPGSGRTVEFRADDGSATSTAVGRPVAITPVNDAPTPVEDKFSDASRAVGNTSLVVDDPSDSAPDPVGPQKAVTGDLLANDTDVDGPSLSVRPETVTTNDGGQAIIEADGDFTYHPPAGCTGGSADSFIYTVEDSHPSAELTATASVGIGVGDCVWYIDDTAPAGGDGRSDAPYNTLADLDGAGGAGDEDASNHFIFLYDGVYTGGLPLEDRQRLWSEKHGLAVPNGAGTGGGTVTLEAADSASSSELQGGLRLALNNDVQGMDLGTSGSPTVFALSGTNVGEAHVNDATGGDVVNPAGGAVSIVPTSGNNSIRVELGQLSSNLSSTNAVSLGSVTGSFSAASGLLRGATFATVALNGGAANFTLGGSVADTTGQVLQISNKTGGTNDFNGSVEGGGISLTSNTGPTTAATTRFDGGLTLSTGSSSGLVATNGGILAVTDPNGLAAPDNRITTTTGTPLSLTSNTLIHADDLVFRKIDSHGASSGIVLSGTGAAGEFRVTGDGTTNGSGGTISNSSGPGISLSNVLGGVDLSRVNVQNGLDDGVRASTVNGFALRNSTVIGNGNDAGENGLDFTNVTGAVTLAADIVQGSADNNVVAVNDSGNLAMTVTNGFYRNTRPTQGNDGILIDGTGSGSQTVTITGNGVDQMFSDNAGDHVQMSTDNSNTVVQDLTINNTRMSTTEVGSATIAGGGISVTPGGTATVDATITNNNIQNSKGTAIAVDTVGSSDATAHVDATIQSNTIGSPGVARSGSFSANGLALYANGSTTVDALVSSNAIHQYTNVYGIDIQQGAGVTAEMNATVRGNVVANPSNALGGAGGVNVAAGIISTDTGVMCLDLGGSNPNNLGDAGNETDASTPDVRVRQAHSAKIQFPQLGGSTSSPAADAAVDGYLTARNVVTTLDATSSPPNTGFLNTTSSCPQPAAGPAVPHP
jgi:hypothetical protein